MRWILLGLFVSFLIVAIFVPVFRFRLETEGFQRQRWDILTEYVLTHSMGWFLIVWVFFFGACLGSFLNVVAYRIPSGLTILGSSRCPWCLVPIKSRYNLPILGWLLLRGRCEACRLPIAVRYVIVEILAGLLLVWLFVSELVVDGRNLPSDEVYRIELLFRRLASGNFQQLSEMSWSLVRIFLVHCLVGYTLLTAALMRLDNFRLPVIWKAVHWAILFAAVSIWPMDFEFARADFQLPGRWGPWLDRFDFQFSGMCVGVVLGIQFQQLVADRQSGLVFAFVFLGTCFGLPATISIGALFLLSLIILSLTPARSFFIKQPLFLLLAALLVQIAFWQRLDQLSFWPNNSANSITLLAFLLAGAVGVVITTAIRSAQPRNNLEPPTATGSSGSSGTQ